MSRKVLIAVLTAVLCILIVMSIGGGAGSKSNDLSGAAVIFETTDIDGNVVTLSDFSDAKVIMINLWEPWCGPCVSEMGDLEKLYETYKDQGFVIVGAFSDKDDASARKIMENNGITYPVVHYDENIAALGTQYVPTTVFIDGSGKLLVNEPCIGAKSYGDWEKILQDLL